MRHTSAFAAVSVSLVALSTATLAQPAAPSILTVGGMIGDGMVIQREAAMPLWGTADARERLTLSIGDKQVKTRADRQGRWRAELPAMTEPGPYEITITRADGDVETISDVLAGDLWLCSGQSNMEYPVSRALNPGSVIGGSADDGIRLLTVEKDTAPAPLAGFETKPAWQAAGPGAVDEFSAACYFFARTLRETSDVPLGLIDASWGGSQIEAWMSSDSLLETGLVDDKIALLQTYAEDERAALARMGADWQSWWNEKRPGQQDAWQVDAETFEGWTAAPETFSSWTDYDDKTINNHRGLAWFATGVTLTEEQAAGGGTLSLGGIDEVDVTWINGEFLNTTFGWGSARTYEVPAGMLKAGENTILVNIYNSWGAGGMTGPGEDVKLTLADGEELPLSSGWHYDVVPGNVGAPPRAPWESVGGLTGMYNAMVAPLGDIPLTGALWYQGESDAGEPQTYETYLGTMVDDWRGRFGGDMAFIVIELANYGTLQAGPVESGWAGVRDAQRRVAVADPRNGLVVTIDTGNPRDIHPADKLTVGKRAAKEARRIVYGESALKTGPRPAHAKRAGDAIIVSFENIDGTLAAIGGPNAFELCGAGGCAYAAAQVGESAVTLSATADEITHVRYCWADAPVCSLFDTAGQPTTPFELAIEDQ